MGQEVRMIGLDFSAAFDRVNHKALLFKLKQLGIGGPFFNILSEFLSNRTQRVVVDGQLGDLRPVVSGVLQGSVLGPLLFILYTHDMWFGLVNMLMMLLFWQWSLLLLQGLMYLIHLIGTWRESVLGVEIGEC